MEDFFKDLGENPHNYGFNDYNSNHDWDFEAREGLEGELSSKQIINLCRQHPK